MNISRATYEPLIHEFLSMNTQINLSAIRDADGVWDKHIRDALALTECLTFVPGSRIVDIGTGGGFPLMPLAIYYPACQFVGVDSVRKKTLAVQEIMQSCGITNTSVVWSRIEDYHPAEQFDYLTARAVAQVDQLLDWCVHLVKPGGYLCLYKQHSDLEYDLLLHHIKKLHLTLVTTHEYSLYEGDIRRVIYIIQR